MATTTPKVPLLMILSEEAIEKVKMGLK